MGGEPGGRVGQVPKKPLLGSIGQAPAAPAQRSPKACPTAAMGSLGWARCEWRGRWKYNMYIPDCIGKPLCGACINSLLTDGTGISPYESATNLHVRRWLSFRCFSQLPPAVLPVIAAFVQDPADSFWKARS